MSICIGTKVVVRAFGMGSAGTVTGYVPMVYTGKRPPQQWEVTLDGRNPHTNNDIQVKRPADRMEILKD